MLITRDESNNIQEIQTQGVYSRFYIKEIHKNGDSWKMYCSCPLTCHILFKDQPESQRVSLYAEHAVIIMHFKKYLWDVFLGHIEVSGRTPTGLVGFAAGPQ